MSSLSKEDLESLLRPQLGKNLVVESFTSKPLTQPGENYGSIMLGIEANVRGGDKSSKRNLSLVAKLVPSSDFQWKEFYPPHTFCKEINSYLLVREEFKKLQIEKNVPKNKYTDIFAEYYGARTSLSNKIEDIADKNAVLLLENLKSLNYRSGDRRVGLDLKHMQLALSRLARFHALSIALKQLKPKVFADTVMKASKPHFIRLDEEETEDCITQLMNNANNIPGCEKYIEKLRKASEEHLRMHLNKSFQQPKEPYAGFCHMDVWVNNILFRYDSSNDSVPVDVKFVDYQMVIYGSPVKDVIFFLYSSTTEEIRAKHYDELIRLYHENFIDCLKSVGCDTSPFSFQSLLDEIEVAAPTEIHHILFMLTAICADQGVVPPMETISHSQIFSNSNDVFQKRAKEFILDFAKRRWL